MIKIETIKELETVFNRENEISEFIPDKAGRVEVVNLDLIRIHINDRIHPDDIGREILRILRNNDEPGPLNIHVETATSCRLTLYADISTI